MILAAGLGERLHPLTTDRSKSTLSVLNRPLVLTPAGKHFAGVVKREPKSGRVLSIHPAPEVPRDFSAARPAQRPSPRPVVADESGPFEFTGLQILDPLVIERIPAGRRSDLVRDVYQPMVQEGKLGAG